MRCKDCSTVRGYPVPAQPSGSAAADEDFGPRSATDMVVGGEVSPCDDFLNRNARRGSDFRVSERCPDCTLGWAGAIRDR